MLRAKSFATVGAAAAAGADEEPFRRFKKISVYAGFGQGGAAEDRFSPLEFDNFVPWVCKQWCASTAVLITRKSQEQYVKFGSRRFRPSANLNRLTTIKPKVTSSFESPSVSSEESAVTDLPAMHDRVIPVTAYYDTKQRLVEISIVGCKATISRKVIHAFSLSIPYHYALTRFTFRKSGLTHQLIYEINKLLPISNITEICFDDSYVREGNYYILLERFSQLKYLSLNRCRINDDVCKRIFKNIDFDYPSAHTLQVLELGTNDITDIGAKFIAFVLRANRCLLHLNLSGNKITDVGFIAILDSLMEFPLNDEEDMAMKRRRLRYFQNKTAAYTRCLKELKYGNMDDDGGTSGRKTALKRYRRKSKKIITEQSVQDVAETMARAIVGDFDDPFSANNIVLKNGLTYSHGNLVLCYLNIAYNHLKYPSIKKLNEVLKYQDDVMIKSYKETGLIRVTIDGNYIPISCIELDEIDFYLKKVMVLLLAGRKTRTSSMAKMYNAKPGSSTNT